MKGFHIGLGLLVAALIALVVLSFNSQPPAPTTPAPAQETELQNPYEFEPLPPRVITPDSEDPIPMVPATDGAFENISNSFVQVRMTTFAGSGVIVRPGMVVTNAHVVYDENGRLRDQRIRVVLHNGRSTSARVVAYSRTYDLAVLEIADNFGTPAQLATERAYVGQRLLAVGNPSEGRTMVHGAVLAQYLPIHHRFVPDRTNQSVRMIVTSCRVVHGYSGGPMVDATTGVVYGITVGQVKYYNDPETGERIRERPYAGVAMDIGEVMAEVDRILPADNG